MGRSLVVVAAITIAMPALAQEAPAARYQITPSGEGFTRLDTETGSLSHCGKRDGVWYCEPLADAETRLEEKLDGLTGELLRLSTEIDRLGAQVAALANRLDGLAAPPGGAATATEGEARGTDDALSFAEELMRRFFDMVRAMKRADVDSI